MLSDLWICNKCMCCVMTELNKLLIDLYKWFLYEFYVQTQKENWCGFVSENAVKAYERVAVCIHSLLISAVKYVWNVIAHAQKPDFVFPRNGRIHLNRCGRQFSRLLAAEVCTSALVMLDTPCSVVAWEYWLPTPFASFPFTSPPLRHHVPSGSERALRPFRCLSSPCSHAK